MIRVALVGIGGMGRCHFNCYKNVENAELVAVCDVRTERAREIAGPDMPIYADLDEMLAKEQFDMLDICTPSYLHREMSIKALEHGLNVLCEKPMSLNSTDAAAIRAAVEKSGKLFMTAHVVRFMAPYAYLKTVVDAGAHGRLLRLDMRRISSLRYRSGAGTTGCSTSKRAAVRRSTSRSMTSISSSTCSGSRTACAASTAN